MLESPGRTTVLGSMMLGMLEASLGRMTAFASRVWMLSGRTLDGVSSAICELNSGTVLEVAGCIKVIY
jgi:hypothetical protein